MIVHPEIATRIRVVVSDCDGVLTDGRVTYVPGHWNTNAGTAHDGFRESCTYSRRDGRGVEKLRAMGIAFEMVTREQSTGPHAARAAKLRCVLLPRPQNESRLDAVRAIAMGTRETGRPELAHVCYVGDSDTDAEALHSVANHGGLAVTPHDGHEGLWRCDECSGPPDCSGPHNIHIHRASTPGGFGVIEEIADAIAEGRVMR